jgi:hypothetical protein
MTQAYGTLLSIQFERSNGMAAICKADFEKRVKAYEAALV